MTTSLDLLCQDVTWVNPDHRVESAIYLMRGHNLAGLPVVDAHSVLGVILDRHLIGAERTSTVADHMDRNVVTVGPDTSLREVADVMIRDNLALLPVVSDDNRLLGIITIGDLLPALRRAVDPTTDLPWSDSLREWAIERLQSGREITVLFFDIDQFGHFNKRYGHVIGDAVLRAVANTLRELTSPATDMLCRYGGDEFCIASERSFADAADLADQVEREVARLRIPGAEDRSITISVGMRGGRRTREREPMHYAATLNNLINLASQECMQHKLAKQSGDPGRHALDEEQIVGREDGANLPATAGAAGEREALVPLKLSFVETRWEGQTAIIRVGLEVITARDEAGDDTTLVESTTILKAGRDEMPVLVARTAAAAVSKTLPPDVDMTVQDLLSSATADGRALVTAIGRFTSTKEDYPVAGCAFVQPDKHRSVANAVIAAANSVPATSSGASRQGGE